MMQEISGLIVQNKIRWKTWKDVINTIEVHQCETGQRPSDG